MKLDPRLKRGSAFALIFLLLAASLYGCAPIAPAATPAETPAQTQETPAKALSAFTSIDLDGNDVTSDMLKNAKVTFINIWGTFCGPCINEMPDLGELAEAYADKGVQFIGIIADASADTADEIELAKEIREKTGASYLHILVSQSVYDAMLTGVSAIPTSFFVNDKGEIISETYVGSKTKAEWQAVIDDVLDAQGVQ